MHKIYTTLLYAFYACASFFLLLYTYTQIDLSLTLSRSGVVQTIQKAFQTVGFYHRPLSVFLFCVILFIFFALYFFFLYQASRNKVSKKQIWIVLGIVSSILVFSYTAAFSYDVFNYIFTAKSVVLYKQNPYSIVPLDFSGIDSMLSFMRWTHLPSAYTPFWIILTLPAYVISFGSLLLNLWFVKIIPILFFHLSVWSIGKILKKSVQESSMAMILFGLNPLVIIEVLVGGHNDIVMLGLALLSFVLWQEKKFITSFFILALSIATKFMTIFLLPLPFIAWSKHKALVLMCIALGLVLMRREFLQWYFLWVVGFMVLYPRRIWAKAAVVGISLGLLMRYVPILYFGGYSEQVVYWQTVLSTGAIVAVAVATIVIAILESNKVFVGKNRV